MKKKRIIGRKDKGILPEFNLVDIDIKVDTGAYTSAIHCHQIRRKEINGIPAISFELLDPSHPKYENQEYETKDFEVREIKNSFGISETRFVIRTTIILLAKEYPIDLSLSERGEMRFPILIGRKFLRGKFIVDPAKSDVFYKKRLKNKQ